jgi:hypothetical protein
MSDTTPTTTKPRSPAGIIDTGARTVTLDGRAPASLDALSEPTRTHLALIGLRHVLRAGPENAWQNLLAGKISTREPAKPKELDPGRLAYAHALVEITKKGEQLTLDQAKERAAKLDKAGLAEAKKHPVVAKHLAKLTGAEIDLLSLAQPPAEPSPEPAATLAEAAD